MANISVTYTFSNGTVADATAVNQNFTDIVNGTSDGTKDMSIAALTVAGTATFNGAVTLGNASGDDLTFTGLAASDFKPKTDATYNLGSTTLGWLGLYLGKNSNRLLLKNNDSASASWTYTYPVNAGVAGQILVNQGSGTMAWKYGCADTSAKSADYTVTDTDMIRTVLMTTSSTTRVVTLPTVADNTGRRITVKKVDSGTGYVTIDGEGSETVDGVTTFTLMTQYDFVTVQSDGSAWHVVEQKVNPRVIDALSNSGMTDATYTDMSGTTSSLDLPIGTWLLQFGCFFVTTNSVTPTSVAHIVDVTDSSNNSVVSSQKPSGSAAAWSASTNWRCALAGAGVAVLASATTVKVRAYTDAVGGTITSRDSSGGYLKATLIKYG